MDTISSIEIISHLNHLLMQESTGDAKQLSNKLGISRATLYRILEALKDYGIEIDYSRERETYYYKHRDNVRINISIEQLTDDELEAQKKVKTFRHKHQSSSNASDIHVLPD